MFGNPIYFITFFTEVISQTIMAKETNKSIDLFQIVLNLAEKRFGILIESEQLNP